MALNAISIFSRASRRCPNLTPQSIVTSSRASVPSARRQDFSIIGPPLHSSLDTQKSAKGSKAEGIDSTRAQGQEGSLRGDHTVQRGPRFAQTHGNKEIPVGRKGTTKPRHGAGIQHLERHHQKNRRTQNRRSSLPATCFTPPRSREEWRDKPAAMEQGHFHAAGNGMAPPGEDRTGIGNSAKRESFTAECKDRPCAWSRRRP